MLFIFKCGEVCGGYRICHKQYAITDPDDPNNLPATRYVVMEASLQRPLADLFHLPPIMLFFLAVVIGILLFLAIRLINSVIKRQRWEQGVILSPRNRIKAGIGLVNLCIYT
jgi:hypothetical protein